MDMSSSLCTGVTFQVDDYLLKLTSKYLICVSSQWTTDGPYCMTAVYMCIILPWSEKTHSHSEDFQVK